MLRAFKAFDRYEPGTNVRAWLYTILHHVHQDALRKTRRAPGFSELTDDGPPVPPPQQALERGGEDLARALGALAEPFRTAVVLRDIEELRYEEIAGVLGIPVGTVMSRIHRGRAWLRERLKEKRP